MVGIAALNWLLGCDVENTLRFCPGKWPIGRENTGVKSDSDLLALEQQIEEVGSLGNLITACYGMNNTVAELFAGPPIYR